MKLLIISSDLQQKLTFKGVNLTVVKWEDKTLNNINVRDYDAVVIDINSLNAETPKQADLNKFENDQINNNIVLDVLNDENSFFFVIGCPGHLIQNLTIDYAMGYDLSLISGAGVSLNPTKHHDTSKYLAYFQTVKHYDYSFEYVLPGQNMVRSQGHTLSYESHLVTRARHPIDAIIKYKSNYGGDPVFKGTLGFFPVSTTLDCDEAIKLLVSSQLGDAPLEIPAWTSKISVAGQEPLDATISEIRDQIDSLKRNLELVQEKRNALRQPLEILYKADKPLEESIKVALRNADINAIDPKDGDNKVEFFIEHGEFRFVVEVKSTKKESIDQKGLRQVLDWQMDAFDETGLEYKALVIVSNNILLEPARRSKQILPDNLESYAKQKKIAVISTPILFDALQKMKNSELTVNEFLGQLNITEGTFSLQEG